jgi:hypothetical protein
MNNLSILYLLNQRIFIPNLFYDNNFFQPFNNDEKVVAYVTITKMPSNFISIKTSTFITQIFNSNNF